MQGQKIRVGKRVCTHHRENVAVWRGLGGFSGFRVSVSVRWGGAGEEGSFRAGLEGRGGGAGICNAGRLHLRLCVLHRRGSNLKCCAMGVWAAENFGWLNTAKPEKYGSSFPISRAERYVPSLSTSGFSVSPLPCRARVSPSQTYTCSFMYGLSIP